MENRNQYSDRGTHTVKRIATKCVPRNALLSMKLSRKTQCAWCGTALIFLYGEFKTGSLSVRCSNCKKTTMIDFSQNESLKVVNE